MISCNMKFYDKTSAFLFPFGQGIFVTAAEMKPAHMYEASDLKSITCCRIYTVIERQ